MRKGHDDSKSTSQDHEHLQAKLPSQKEDQHAPNGPAEQQETGKQESIPHVDQEKDKQERNVDHGKHGSSPDNPIRLSVVVCGDRSGETLVLLKSAVIFSHTYQVFHLFAEDHAKKELSEEVREVAGSL